MPPKPRTTSSLLHESMVESQMWSNIRRKAVSDQALKDMLDQVKMYYLLKYDRGDYAKLREQND